MNVPLLDLKAQYAAIREEIRTAIDEVMDSQHFILGPKVAALEQQIAVYSGAKYAIGVASGSDALLLALMALDIGPGDEVITTPYTFFATASAVSRLGATPVFVDIHPRTYNIDPDGIEEKITEHTRAILPVHLFGQMADMDPIMEVANRHGLKVVEDAAQSIGATYRGKKAGAIAELGCFSFFPSKNLGGYGDGGMVVTNEEDAAERIRVLRVHGSKPKYYHQLVGINSRLDALQAAVLSTKLNYLEGWSAARRRHAAFYDAAFSDVNVETPHIEPFNVSIYNQYILRVEGRDELMAHLKKQGIGCEIYYPVPLHLQACYQHLGYREGDFPESERAARETLALPVYPELTERQQEYVVSRIKAFISGEIL
ncbi:MAG: DegT/DnrJ/EryC1/StrS family aminotransferase [Candidatus Latescibacteria bacterium]|nr:DegT/DnrJ/EryC1/StrS family aminotransferase [Candidatus Latescibacterota bacterium]MCK5328363.1 DegT/DnrJ/EryC1/StrS family aminotransferase [Candidatus Latescibacterota bacterium]